jgi:hypothetical protein
VFGEDLLSGNGFDETLSQYKRIGLSPLQTTEREWYFSVITLPISYYPSYYMARPPYSPVQEKVFWHPLWNSILDKQLKSGCSVRKKPDNNQKGWTLKLYAVASIKLNNNDKKKKWLHCVPTLTLLLLLYSLLDYPLNSPMAGSYHFEISERGTKGAQLIAPKIIIKRERPASRCYENEHWFPTISSRPLKMNNKIMATTK